MTLSVKACGFASSPEGGAFLEQIVKNQKHPSKENIPG